LQDIWEVRRFSRNQNKSPDIYSRGLAVQFIVSSQQTNFISASSF
jgi:hypothetical protein